MKALGKTTYIVTNLLVLGLSILFACLFSLIGSNGGFFGFAPVDKAGLGVYITFKVLVSLSLVAMVLATCFGKNRQEGVSATLMTFTLGVQLLPLVSRAMALVAKNVNNAHTWAWGVSLGVESIVFVVYVSTVLFLFLIKGRMIQTREAVKPAEVKTTDARSVFDENGNFKGPRG